MYSCIKSSILPSLLSLLCSFFAFHFCNLVMYTDKTFEIHTLHLSYILPTYYNQCLCWNISLMYTTNQFGNSAHQYMGRLYNSAKNHPKCQKLPELLSFFLISEPLHPHSCMYPGHALCTPTAEQMISKKKAPNNYI